MPLDVRSVRQSASRFSSSETVNSASRRLDYGLDAGYPRARAVPAERYSYRVDPPDQSVGAAHDGYRLRPDARPTRWLEIAQAPTDLTHFDPQSNWLRC